MAGIGNVFTNSFNVGTDLSITIRNNSSNAAVTLDGKKTMFEAEDKSALLESKTFDNGGKPDHRVIPGGWRGSIRVDRSSGTFQQLYAYLEAQFYLGQGQAYFTITTTINNPTNTGTTRFQYTNVVFHGYKPGSYERESIVSSTIEFAAQECVAL